MSMWGAARLAFGDVAADIDEYVGWNIEVRGDERSWEPAMVDGHNRVESTPRIKKGCKGYHYQSTGTSRHFLCFRFLYEAS